MQQNVFFTNNVRRASDDVDRLSQFLFKAEIYANAYVAEFHQRCNDVPIYSALLDKFNANLKELRDSGLPLHLLESCLRENFPSMFLNISRSPTIESFQYSGIARYLHFPGSPIFILPAPFYRT